MMAQDFVLSVACTADGNWVVSGSKDRGVQFWDPRTGHTQFMLQGHRNSGNYLKVFVRILDVTILIILL
jgi:WD40 repeat protein